MDRLHRAIKDVHRLDDLAARDTWLNRLAPLPKLLAAVVYLAVTLSFGRYQLTGVLGMGLWPLLLLELADFTPGDALRAFKPVAVLLTVVGLCNLPFDRAVLLHAGPLSVTGGMLSLGVLLAKGLFCFLVGSERTVVSDDSATTRALLASKYKYRTPSQPRRVRPSWSRKAAVTSRPNRTLSALAARAGGAA